MRPARLQFPAETRCGSAYVAVLGISMLVATIGLGAMLAVRSQRRAADLAANEAEARAASQGAVEVGLGTISVTPGWRSAFGNNVYTSARSLGRGTVAMKLTDEADGDLADDALEPVRLYGAGRAGSAARITSVLLNPTGPAVNALQMAVYSAGDLTLSGTAWEAGGAVGCAGGCTVSLLAVFNGDVECGSMVSLLGTVNGTVTTGAAARAMPPATAYDLYRGVGTAIPFSSIISGNMSKKLLAPASNPYGAANAAGVYTIDVPALSTLTISQSRLGATLVVNLGLSATLTVSGANAWDPPAEGMPTLIVKGSGLGTVNINGSTAPLSEAVNSVNYNPAGSAYFGISNATTTDTYPSEVRGVVHVVGSGVSLSIGSNATVRGCVLSDGGVSISGGAMVIADPGLYANPPRGYITPTALTPAPGTWRREQDD